MSIIHSFYKTTADMLMNGDKIKLQVSIKIVHVGMWF